MPVVNPTPPPPYVSPNTTGWTVITLGATSAPYNWTTDSAPNNPLNLADNTNYVLLGPNRLHYGTITINPGNNSQILVKRLYKTIGLKNGTSDPSAGTSTTGQDSGAANFNINNATNTTIWIEGMHIDGMAGPISPLWGYPVEQDGLRPNCPGVTIWMKNCRIERLIGGLDPPHKHADCIQTAGGCKELHAEDCYFDSHYNNLYFRRENDPINNPIKKLFLNRVECGGYATNPSNTPPYNGTNTTPGGLDSTLRAISLGTQPIPPSDNNSTVNMVNPCAVWLYEFYGDPPTGTNFVDFAHPARSTFRTTITSPSDGVYSYWPQWDTSTAPPPGETSPDTTNATLGSGDAKVLGVVKQGPNPYGNLAPANRIGLSYTAPFSIVGESVAQQLPANTADGKLHRASSGHYYAAPANVTDARTWASGFDCIVTNSSKLGGFSDDMIVENPNLVIGMYGKSIQANNPNSLPDNWHTHNSAGNKIAVFNNKYYQMQADHASTNPYSDPRGFSVSLWKDWIAKDAWIAVSNENAKYSSDPLAMTYLDSMSQYQGSPVSWRDGHTYTADEFHTITYGVGDACSNAKPNSGYYVFGNGLRNGEGYFPVGSVGSTAELLDHLEGAVAESWIRDNGAAATAFKSEANWRLAVELLMDTNTRGKYCWCVVNINNLTANTTLVPANFTAAQLEQWRRYSICSFLYGNNGLGFYEWVESVSILPWNDTHPYYSLALGNPIDTYTTAVAGFDAARGVYKRRFQNGAVFINVSGSAKTFTGDRTYQNLDGTAIAGNSITLANNSAIAVKTSGSGGGGGSTEVLTSVLVDTYSRTVAAGSLGTADTGQTYTLRGSATDYSVNGTSAVVSVPLSSSRAAIPNLTGQDLETYVQVNISELATGDNETFYVWLRGDQPNNTGYRFRMLLTPSNQIQWQLQSIVANVTGAIGTLQTMAWTPSANTNFDIRFRTTGINPTTVQARGWRDSDPEPTTWTVDTTDTTAALQVANLSPLWSCFVESGNLNSPVIYNVKDFKVWTVEFTTPPVHNPPDVQADAPLDGDSFTIATGQTNYPFTASVFVTPDTGSTITNVTVAVGAGTPQTMTRVGTSNQYTRSLTLGSNSYTLNYTATDDQSTTTAISLNITILPPPPPITPEEQEPDVEFIPAPSAQVPEWVTVLLDHRGIAIGEVAGSDLRFGRYVGQSGFMSFDISKFHELNSQLEAFALDYSIRRNGVEYAAGEIREVNRDTDDAVIQISGNDWREYFDELTLPFDPSKGLSGQNFVKSDTDLTVIAELLIDKVLQAYPNSIDVTHNNPKTGIVQSHHFLAPDLESLQAMLDTMAKQTPGFDWEITPAKEFKIYAPEKSRQATIIFDNRNIKQVHFGQLGVQATILYGRGTGTGSSQAIEKRSATNGAREKYRDRVGIFDFGTVASRAVLKTATSARLKETSNQALEFWVTILPQGEDILALVEDGDYVRINYTDGELNIDGVYRCMGYEVFIDAERNEEITFNFDVTPDVD